MSDTDARNLRLTLAYDGTNYVGWQIQPNGITVQEVVQQKLSELTGEETNVIAAGRTDSGVHALGQVINFQTHCSIPTDRFPQALQRLLPDDIVVRDAQDVPDLFHATYSAVGKCYRYVIQLGETTLPFLRNSVWRVRAELDLNAMREAAEHLVGTHDFRCFESHFPNKATSVRTVKHLSLKQTAQWEMWRDFDFSALSTVAAVSPEFLCLEISADGFLYNMVRAITGTLVDVGRGRFTPAQVAQMLDEENRSLAGPTAPPQGLYLVNVEYDLENLRPHQQRDE